MTVATKKHRRTKSILKVKKSDVLDVPIRKKNEQQLQLNNPTKTTAHLYHIVLSSLSSSSQPISGFSSRSIESTVTRWPRQTPLHAARSPPVHTLSSTLISERRMSAAPRSSGRACKRLDVRYKRQY